MAGLQKTDCINGRDAHGYPDNLLSGYIWILKYPFNYPSIRDLRSFVIRFDFELYVRFEIRFVLMFRFEIFESSALSIVIRKETIGSG